MRPEATALRRATEGQGNPFTMGIPQAAAARPQRRRSDAGQVRLQRRDLDGLLLLADHYAAPYDLLGAALAAQPSRLRGIVARWRAAGYAHAGVLGPGRPPGPHAGQVWAVEVELTPKPSARTARIMAGLLNHPRYARVVYRIRDQFNTRYEQRETAQAELDQLTATARQSKTPPSSPNCSAPWNYSPTSRPTSAPACTPRSRSTSTTALPSGRPPSARPSPKPPPPSSSSYSPTHAPTTTRPATSRAPPVRTHQHPLYDNYLSSR